MSDGSYYEAKADDCINSIAHRHGLFWETVWEHAENAELRKKREDPNVLMAGDLVFIPVLQMRYEAGATEARHRFRVKGAPAVVSLRFLDTDGNPRADLPFRLDIDGTWIVGMTDEDGCIIESIPPGAKRGSVTLRDGETEEMYDLELGTLDPVTENEGARQRLVNLGYDCADSDCDSDDFRNALKQFQLARDLEVTGELGEATHDSLLKDHGS